MSELPTDAIKYCINNASDLDGEAEAATIELQALLDEIKRFRDECTDCPFCTPLTKQGGKQ